MNTIKRLAEKGIINSQKIVQGSSTFLGHLVSNSGIQPLPERIVALRDFTQPSDAKGLRRFLGMINFYRSFLSHAANIMAALQTVIATLRGSQSIIWTPELSQESNLPTHPHPTATFGLFADASLLADNVARISARSSCFQEREKTNMRDLRTNRQERATS